MAGSTTRMAWRNLWRNGRRTGLALAAIGLSITLVLAYDAVLRAYGGWMVQVVTGPMLGDVQVHATGWRTDRALHRTIPRTSAIVAMLAADAAVADVAPRVYAPALAARGEEGFAVLVLGVEVGAERGPMRLLEGLDVPLTGGQVAVGRLLASQMALRAGDTLAIVGQGVDGSLANDLYTVAAIIDTPVDLVNRQAVVMPLAESQALFVFGDEAHELVVHARAGVDAAALAARLASAPAFSGLEARDWRTIAPDLASLVALVDIVWVFVLALVLLAAAAGVANTMLMATFERTHEFGMLLALGTSPARIVRLVLTEAVALGLVGAALGTAAGVTLVAITSRTGVNFAALGGGPSTISFAGLQWSMLLYPTLALADVVRAVVAVVMTSVLAAAWPAIRAARLQPAAALRA